MKAPHNPIDVANYIVWRANVADHPITHLKLQKLLYYVVARFAKEYDAKLINEDVMKWQYGPVVKSVYHHFKLWGQKEITSSLAYLLPTSDVFNLKFADVNEINENLHNQVEVERQVSYVLNELLACSAFDLVDRTHQESAWKNYESEILKANQDLPYSLSELRAANI